MTARAMTTETTAPARSADRTPSLPAPPSPPALSGLSAEAIGRSIRRHLLLAGLGGILLVAGLGGWATTTSLAGAVIAGGHLVVDSSVKTVQHPTGGVVGALHVRDGQRVEAGQVLLSLDDTATRASLRIVTNNLEELATKRARLLAERDGLAEIALPEPLRATTGDPRIADLLAGEQRLFAIRRAALEGQRAQLRERMTQLDEEIRGLEAQREAKASEMRIVAEEVAGVRQLWEKKLVPLARLTDLERAAARLEGEHGALIAAVSQARGRISETELQIIQLDQDHRSAVAKELGEAEAKIAELEERRVAAEDQLARIDLRAPQAGRVHQLAVHTVGGVIGAGEAVMRIVPEADALTVEARIAPQDVDQLHVGQEALLRLSALNQRTTPEIHGAVDTISPDLVEDKLTGITYYQVRIGLSEAEMQALGDVDLVPGMPVEAFIHTEDRTVLSYLVKPLADQVARAFRED